MSLKDPVRPSLTLAVLGKGLMAPTSPVVRADDAGVLRGDGIFETVRVNHGRAFLLAEHLSRMAQSARRAQIAAPSDHEWEELVAEALAGYGDHDGAARLVCTRGPESGSPVAFVLVGPVPPAAVRAREEGVRAVTVSLGVTARGRAGASWLLPGVKTTSYAVAMAAVRHAEALGYDDAIWVSVDGEVLEAPTATVAWIQAGRLVSPNPAEEVGILAGTTLAYVARLAADRGVEVELRHGTVDELLAADEAMLLSSVRGVAPLLAVDDTTIGDGGVGRVTAALRAAYETALARA